MGPRPACPKSQGCSGEFGSAEEAPFSTHFGAGPAQVARAICGEHAATRVPGPPPPRPRPSSVPDTSYGKGPGALVRDAPGPSAARHPPGEPAARHPGSDSGSERPRYVVRTVERTDALNAVLLPPSHAHTCLCAHQTPRGVGGLQQRALSRTPPDRHGTMATSPALGAACPETEGYIGGPTPQLTFSFLLVCSQHVWAKAFGEVQT